MIKSLPKERVIETNKERPNEASQAPNVNKIINKKVLFWGAVPMVKVKKGTNIRIIPSKHNKDISKCFRWIISLVIVIIIAETKKIW